MSQVDQSEITTALLQSVESGVYPESQDVAAAELASKSLPAISKAVQEARKAVEAEIGRLSREAAPNIDGWIQQAQQLQVDIEQSKAVAHEIVKQAEESSLLREVRKDAATKLDLLRIEVDFNQRLRETLESIQDITNTLQVGQDAVQQNKLNYGLEQYVEARSALADLGTEDTTIAVDLLQQRAGKLRAALVESAEQHWNALLQTDSDASRISIRTLPNGKSGLGLQETADLMMQLDVFESSIIAFCRDLNNIIFKPRLQPIPDGQVSRVELSENDLQLKDRTPSEGAVHLIGDLTAILQFLVDRLPSAIIARVSEILMPSLISSLTSTWLNTSVSTSLEALPQYEILLNAVSQFAAVLNEQGWQGSTDLIDWVEDAPKVWLAKRRETALTSVRDSLTHHIRNTTVVERIETQMVAKDDIIAPPSGPADDWDAGWSVEEGTEDKAPPPTQPIEEEDMSAWDDDGEAKSSGNDPEISSVPADAEVKNGAGEEDVDPAEAWGWDDQEKQSEPRSPVAMRSQHLGTNGHAPETKPVERELTLKETYTVTGVPDKLLEMIVSIVSDASNLRQPEFSESPIAPAAVAMYSIPTLVLAGFRALAPTYYDPLEGGNMYLYNDSLRLTSELSSFLSRQAEEDASSELPTSAWPSNRMKLETDIKALSSFGKRAYGKEMESQRTILGDLLDGAQGFENCTEAPFAAECENAVAMTVDRLREVCKQWTPILSRSALLQSLGSLVGTVVNKVITDICDLSDISEEESARLRHFCDEFAKLTDIFTQEGPDGQQSEMTSMYTPHWFKLQYLGEILDSSLADIKFLWQDSELKVDFDVEQVVDLIEALFAESDYRRRAIAEIRHG